MNSQRCLGHEVCSYPLKLGYLKAKGTNFQLRFKVFANGVLNMDSFISDWNLFRKLRYHLGLKASLGGWKVCATTNPWIERTSVHQKINDEFLVNCCNFTVISDQSPFDEDNGLDVEMSRDPILNSAFSTPDEVESEPHFVTLSFGSEFHPTFQRNVPISGRVCRIQVSTFFAEKESTNEI
jgi:hypothetical protein